MAAPTPSINVTNLQRPSMLERVLSRAGDMLRFYRAVLWTAFRHSWRVTGTTATAIALILAIIAYKFPSSRITKMTDLPWQIPVGTCVTVVVVRLLLAPYWLYKDKELQAQSHEVDLEAKDREIRDLKREIHALKRTGPGDQEPRAALAISDIFSEPASRSMWDIWRTTDVTSGVPAFVAFVSNSPASEGKSTRRADDLAVTIIFKNPACNEIARVARAYWLGHSANNVDINAGEQQTILIGLHKDGAFWIFDNPRKYPTQRPRYMSSHWRPPTGKSDIFSIPAFVDIEIVVMSTETGETYCIRRGRLTKGDSGAKIEML